MEEKWYSNQLSRRKTDGLSKLYGMIQSANYGLGKDEELGFHDYKIMLESQMEDLEKQIFLKEKIFEQIKKSIKTKKYKDVDSICMRNIHF